MKEEIAAYEQAVKYILDIPKFTTKNHIETTKAFLEKLGNPDREMKIFHIAGTNGKGSVCAYLRSILEEAGFSTGMFTSPHLVDIRERFRINGEMISKEQFLKAFLKVYRQIEENHPTFFEYLFFMALLIFKENKTEYVLLETGLGGRLDATNSVKEKLVSVITETGFDHMEYLGNTLSEIAGEKAGIIAENTPVVYLQANAEVSRVIEMTAVEKGSKTVPVKVECDAICKNTNKSIDFSFHSRYYGCIRLTLSTVALFQTENAALAVEAIGAAGLTDTITKDQVQKGISKAFWEGRMEEVLPGIYVDGAHNEDGMRAFLTTVRTEQCEGRRIVLFSAMHDKRYKEMVSLLIASGLFGMIAAAPLENARALNKKELETVFDTYTKDITKVLIFETPEEAFKEMQLLKGEKDRLYVVGSLYLVGRLKAYLRRQTDD